MKQFILTSFLIVLTCPFLSYSKNLEVIGTVVAQELSYGHSYSIYKAEEVPTTYLIVRVDNPIQGVEASKYILVSFMWNKGSLILDRNNSKWQFKLSRNKGCDSNLKKLQYVFFGSKQVSGIQPRFLRTSAYDNETIPFDFKLPCYTTNLKKMQKMDSPTSVSKDTEEESYVTENSLWINPQQTPLKVFFGGEDKFTNMSDKTISQFVLGCVIEQSDAFQVVKLFPVEKSEFRPNGTAFSVNNAGSASSMDKLYTCYEMKAKLTAVRVKFEDDSIWELK